MPTPTPETLEIEVFRAGDYGPKGTFTEADLDAMASDYDPARHHEAPVTLDHAQNGPAQGWVGRVRRAGDRLLATLTRLSPTLRDALGGGHYKKRSVELYRAFEPTGRPYLKAVSFLGAAAPEVKGLTDPIFQEVLENEAATRVPQAHPAPEPEAPGAADAKRRLVESGHWRPAWEERGLVKAFAQLGAGDALEALVGALQDGQSAVAFGETHSHPATSAPTLAFHGEASPESLRLHERAIAFQTENPNVTYAESLLHISR
ncbi:MAG: hypothetical protein RLY93_05800 [Sumerlaeia bacterium]